MSGKGLGIFNIATSISLLPITHDSRPLFIVAISFFACGLTIFSTTIVLARIARNKDLKAS